jgi:hypothetical protein
LRPGAHHSMLPPSAFEARDDEAAWGVQRAGIHVQRVLQFVFLFREGRSCGIFHESTHCSSESPDPARMRGAQRHLRTRRTHGPGGDPKKWFRQVSQRGGAPNLLQSVVAF